MLERPIVYVGPTLRAEEVHELLPNAIIRPPIRRIDLYRDRTLGGTTFVIIDGVFLQHLAVSPREVLDVLRDGGRVIGASSMGALRAAECWPMGMVGQGVIFRSFRCGALTSDDEVAVSFDPEHPERASVPLVNVRYAARAAWRRGLVARVQADVVVAVASRLFYADRHWSRILRLAEVREVDEFESLATEHDLKRLDAMRALRYVARQQHAHSGSTRQRPRRSLIPRELTRERRHDALMDLSKKEAKQGLAEWLILSGRYRSLIRAGKESHVWIEKGPPPSVQNRLWKSLEVQERLDQELFRFQAFRAANARVLNVEVHPRELEAMKAELSQLHGYADWSGLEVLFTAKGQARLNQFACQLAKARKAAFASHTRRLDGSRPRHPWSARNLP